MISWTTKTLFQGLFPIPSYKVKQALKAHEDVHCFYQGKEMIVKELDLEPKKVKESEIFDDKSRMNGGKQYQLFYYMWSPKSNETLTREFLGY
jgi:hypothetical protein